MKQQIMHEPISKSGGSNHGSPVFLRFGYPMVNLPTHSLKSLDHFLLTTKNKPCRLDQRNVHYVSSWEVCRHRILFALDLCARPKILTSFHGIAETSTLTWHNPFGH